MTPAAKVLGAGGRQDDPWPRLAAVARERAFEQSAWAADAEDAAIAEAHLEQHAFLIRLAEIYERRARAD